MRCMYGSGFYNEELYKVSSFFWFIRTLRGLLTLKISAATFPISSEACTRSVINQIRIARISYNHSNLCVPLQTGL